MKEANNKRVKHTQWDYSSCFKLFVVAQIEKGDMTYKQAQQHYGTQGRNTVLVWTRHNMIPYYMLCLVQNPKKHQIKRLNA